MRYVKVRFEHGGGDMLSLLEIHTSVATAPVLARLGQVLFDLRVQVVHSDSHEDELSRVERIWVVDWDGAPLRAGRRFELQVEVLRAIDSLPAQPVAVSPRPLRRVPAAALGAATSN
jgi:hypothetical protein